jgi:hypothetical protein
MKRRGWITLLFNYSTNQLRGFIQFARPGDGSYDPICFDARRSANNREYPIVRLNHENILCRNEIGSPKNIAASFYRLVFDFVRRA